MRLSVWSEVAALMSKPNRIPMAHQKLLIVTPKMDRTRLTITLKKSILVAVDSVIDGTNIRNRSHAIETLISQSLAPQAKTCLILAGGRGINMRPFTFEMPKGLFPVAGKPILEHLIELLSRYNIRNIILSIGHLGEKIEEYFGNGQKF